MKKYTPLSFIILSVIALSSCNSKKVQPEQQLSQTEIDHFKYDISRYISRLPKHVSHETKFETKFDDIYKEKSKKTNLDKYFVGENDTIFFEVSQLAPSVKYKKVATGGKLHKNKDGEIVYYEETYRTWKMDTTLLTQRTAIFFDDMINHKSLRPYYTEQINDDTHIEFPSNSTYYNKKNRRWELTNDVAVQP